MTFTCITFPHFNNNIQNFIQMSTNKEHYIIIIMNIVCSSLLTVNIYIIYIRLPIPKVINMNMYSKLWADARNRNNCTKYSWNVNYSCNRFKIPVVKCSITTRLCCLLACWKVNSTLWICLLEHHIYDMVYIVIIVINISINVTFTNSYTTGYHFLTLP